MTNRSMRRRSLLALGGAVAVAGCLGDDDDDTPTATPHPTPAPSAWAAYDELGPMDIELATPDEPPELEVSVEPIIEQLEVPWDLDYDSAGNLYLTERTGQVLRFDAETVETVAEPIDAIDAETAEDGWWVEGGEGGTLGIAVSPGDTHVYVYYTADPNGLHNRVVRYPIDGEDVGDGEVIIDDIPADDRIHNGGRIAFGPDGHLWITTGDADDPAASRDPSSLAGKVLRVTAEGDAPDDNPDHGGDDRIYAAGVRNAQGLTWVDDVPIITDHGALGHDAISLLYPGGDYGWPAVRGDDEDNYADHPEVVPPVALAGIQSWATSGATWYTGDDVASWTNRLLVGTLTHQRLFVVTLSPPDATPPGGGTTFEEDHFDQTATATIHEALVDEIGRIRHVEQGPNGELYALTSNWDGRAEDPFPVETDDRLVRITDP